MLRYVVFSFALIFGVFLAITECLDDDRLDKAPVVTDEEKKEDLLTADRQARQGTSSQNAPSFIPANLQASYFLGQCVMCPPGNPGPRGVPGPQGVPGRDGRDAILLGPQEGVSRPPNPRPPTRPPIVDGNFAGVTYIRWGRSVCPSHNYKIYNGVMASSNNGHKGSGANFLCLPMNPRLTPTTHSHRRSTVKARGWPRPGASPAVQNAPIYGTEYNERLPESQNILNSEAPCAVCQATGRQGKVLIPGSVECFGEGWTLEYRGFMMSSLYTSYKSEFVCVDGHAEGIHRSAANNEESTIVPVQVKCSTNGGGLPCAPYADGQDLPCVVCTK